MKYHFLILFFVGHAFGVWAVIHGVTTDNLWYAILGTLVLFSPSRIWPSWK